MPVTSTNAIRNFADRVRGLAGNNKELTLSASEARLLNHEIQQLMARLIELQDLTETGKIQVEVSSNKF
jgi:RNA polymerase-interacting CarD/CdnL/TRCF family regulator